MSLLNVLIPLVTLIIGAGLTYYADSRRRLADRTSARSDGLREQRASAYRQFIRSAHTSAHMIGRTADGCPEPLVGEDVASVRALVDSDVARDLYEMMIFAERATWDAANDVRQALYLFRNAVQGGAHYRSDEYRAPLHAYQRYREQFLELARLEVLG